MYICGAVCKKKEVLIDSGNGLLTSKDASCNLVNRHSLNITKAWTHISIILTTELNPVETDIQLFIESPKLDFQV